MYIATCVTIAKGIRRL